MRLEDGKVIVPEKGKKSSRGFSYIGPKLCNHLPSFIRKTTIRVILAKTTFGWKFQASEKVRNYDLLLFFSRPFSFFQQ